MSDWKDFDMCRPEPLVTYMIAVLGQNGTNGEVKAFYRQDSTECECGWITEDNRFFSVYENWNILYSELEGYPAVKDMSVFAKFLEEESYNNAF